MWAALREVAAWLLAISLALGGGAGAGLPLAGPDAATLAFAAGSICSSHPGSPLSGPDGSGTDHSCCTHACCVTGPLGLTPQAVQIRLPHRVAVATVGPAPRGVRHTHVASAAHRPRAPPVFHA